VAAKLGELFNLSSLWQNVTAGFSLGYQRFFPMKAEVFEKPWALCPNGEGGHGPPA
jgi:hypothetical protein